MAVEQQVRRSASLGAISCHRSAALAITDSATAREPSTLRQRSETSMEIGSLTPVTEFDTSPISPTRKVPNMDADMVFSSASSDSNPDDGDYLADFVRCQSEESKW